MMKRILCLAAACAAFVSLSSKDASAQTAYAYGSSLDLQGGILATVYSVDGEARTALGVAGGGDFKLRYTYYFNRHWGAFASFGLGGASASYEDFLGVVNNADGMKYKYDNTPGCWEMSSSLVPSFLVGGAFRFDWGNWSLRPRVGIGVGSYENSGYSYDRYSRTGSSTDPEKYYCLSLNSCTGKTQDYLVNGSTYYDNSSVFVMAASCQLTYTVHRHFFFSVEAGMTAIPQPMTYTLTEGTYVPATATTWAQAVYNYGALTRTDTQTTLVKHAGPSFNLNVGIGWNIGWNRNESNWYNRK